MHSSQNLTAGIKVQVLLHCGSMQATMHQDAQTHESVMDAYIQTAVNHKPFPPTATSASLTPVARR
jgi:hypothetical protein